MSKINTNISIDGELKKQAVQLFSSFGLDLSTAITLFLQQSVREQRIPFEITMNVYNKDTLDAFNEYAKMKDKNGGYKRYDSFNDILKEVIDDAKDS